MPRKTKEERLNQQLLDARDINRNAMAALTEARREREEAREKCGKVIDECSQLLQRQAGSRRQTVALFRLIYETNIKLARKEGYIDRVREVDDKPRIIGPTEDPDISDLLCRQDLAEARTERRIGEVIEEMDPDTLNRVLGREDD